MKKTTAILAALSMGLLTATAGVAPAPVTGKNPPPPPPDPCAGPISYNNIELLYANTDLGGYYDDDSDGVVLRAEYSPANNIYLTASGGYHDWDSGNMWQLSAGIGAYVPLTDNIHLAADGGVCYVDWEQDYYRSSKGSSTSYYTVSDSDTGWYVRPHLRAKFGCLTVHAGATYKDVGDEDDWSWFVSAYYQIMQNWDLTVGYSDGDQSETITGGVRMRY
jgi:outer membrane cobalamin receptor